MMIHSTKTPLPVKPEVAGSSPVYPAGIDELEPFTCLKGFYRQSKHT